ncbi:hypothetical protein IID24_04350 [Patescibacteria group bacterium]|nr:hypothetical protein [Patescibacteria group bacterium]
MLGLTIPKKENIKEFRDSKINKGIDMLALVLLGIFVSAAVVITGGVMVDGFIRIIETWIGPNLPQENHKMK